MNGSKAIVIISSSKRWLFFGLPNYPFLSKFPGTRDQLPGTAQKPAHTTPLIQTQPPHRLASVAIEHILIPDQPQRSRRELTVALLIGLWISDELSFDHYFPSHARIVKVTVTKPSDAGLLTTDLQPPPRH